MAPDGTCVKCGDHIGEPPSSEQSKVPWHFWILVVALVVYLGWRFLQLLSWIA